MIRTNFVFSLGEDGRSQRVNYLKHNININFKADNSYSVTRNGENLFTSRKRDFRLELLKELPGDLGTIYRLSYAPEEGEYRQVTFVDKNNFDRTPNNLSEEGVIPFQGDILTPILNSIGTDGFNEGEEGHEFTNNLILGAIDFFHKMQSVWETMDRDSPFYQETTEFCTGFSYLMNSERETDRFMNSDEIPFWISNRSSYIKIIVILCYIGRGYYYNDEDYIREAEILAETYWGSINRSAMDGYSVNSESLYLNTGVTVNLTSLRGFVPVSFELLSLEGFEELLVHIYRFWTYVSDKNNLRVFASGDYERILSNMGYGEPIEHRRDIASIIDTDDQCAMDNFYQSMVDRIFRIIENNIDGQDICASTPASARAIRSNFDNPEELEEFKRFIMEKTVIRKLNPVSVDFVDGNRIGLLMRVVVQPNSLVPVTVTYSRSNSVSLTPEEQANFFDKWIGDEFIVHFKNFSDLNQLSIYLKPPRPDDSYLVNVFTRDERLRVDNIANEPVYYYRYCHGDGTTLHGILDTLCNVNFLSPVNSDIGDFRRTYGLERHGYRS